MERSIGYKMAELEPIKGYNCTKTAISQERLLRKKLFTNPYSSYSRGILSKSWEMSWKGQFLLEVVSYDLLFRKTLVGRFFTGA